MNDALVVAFRTVDVLSTATDFDTPGNFRQVTYNGFVQQLKKVWDIFGLNGKAIQSDFELVTKGKQSQLLPEHTTAINPSNIFIEQGAKVYPGIINAETGPVYIGKDAEVMEGCIIRGPFAMGEHAVLKMAAKVYSNTT